MGVEHVFVGLGVVYASWWHFDATVAIAENKHADPRALDDLRNLGRALNLRLIDEDEPSRPDALLRATVVNGPLTFIYSRVQPRS
jgi:hypothetical protein